MKPAIQVNKDSVKDLKLRFNETRDPENDWQSLLKAIISQVMGDYIRLQHPSRRDQHYLKESFCSAIACLWDADYVIEWPGEKDNIQLSFREILAQRFGLEELSIEEIHKINLGIIQDECIKDAKAYWIDKQLNIVSVPDFLVFDGRAFSIWRSEEKSKIDYENCILYIEDTKDNKVLSERFLELALEMGLHFRDIKIENTKEIGSVVYELLRMNACFR